MGYEMTKSEMRNDVTTVSDTAPPSAEILAYYKRIGALESGGSYISFSKNGAWLDQDDKNIDGSLWTVEMSTICAGARKWKDGQIVVADFDLIANGKLVPEREGLGDNEKAKWGLGGDPWQRGFMLRFIDETGNVVVWAALTNGARQAVGNLLTVWSNRCERGRGGWPVVKLAAGGYEHKTFGFVSTPKLVISSWSDGAAPVETKPTTTKVTITSGPDALAKLAKATPAGDADPNERDEAPLEAEDSPFWG